jgi:hypothetical protein
MGARVKGGLRPQGSRRERNKESLALAEQEGEQAYGAGVPVEANPYPDGGGLAYSGRWARWQYGWRWAEGAPVRAANVAQARALRAEWAAR